MASADVVLKVYRATQRRLDVIKAAMTVEGGRTPTYDDVVNDMAAAWEQRKQLLAEVREARP